jgi:hypothetical protein
MEKIKARFILEGLGRPPEHLTEFLNDLVGKMDNEKEMKIIDKVLHEPVPVKESKDLYSTFAEIEAEFESVESYLGALFTYMPSNVEIFHPENFKINVNDFNVLSNALIKRLHDYDAIAKQMLAEKDILVNQLNAFRKAAQKVVAQRKAEDADAQKTRPIEKSEEKKD